MSDRRTLIVTGLVLLLIFALVGGVIFYLFNFIQNRQNPAATQDLFPTSSSNIVIATPAPTSPAATANNRPITNQTQPVQSQNQAPTITTNQVNKIYTTSNFQLKLPKSWGVTSCSNSKNIELDPYNASDQTITCSKATKPVTILVGQNSCVGGQVITLGNVQVRKIVDTNFVTNSGSGTEYHWCTLSGVKLDITHRVGTGPAFSQDDFSSQVEQVISALSFY